MADSAPVAGAAWPSSSQASAWLSGRPGRVQAHARQQRAAGHLHAHALVGGGWGDDDVQAGVVHRAGEGDGAARVSRFWL
jgi:hypothetical protein